MTAQKPTMTDMLDFMECDTCRAKTGTPLLCAGCLHNRGAISELRRQLTVYEHAPPAANARIAELEATLKATEDHADMYRSECQYNIKRADEAEADLQTAIAHIAELERQLAELGIETKERRRTRHDD